MHINNKQIDSSSLSWIILLIILVIIALLRIRLLQIPLERDEGGYAYTAQLILQGIPPFAQAYDMKMPGLYYVYALFLAAFGQTITGIHLGLLVMNAASIILIFLIGRKLFNNTVGLLAAAAYGFMSLSQAVQGFSANAEHLLLPPALAGILLVLKGRDLQHTGFLFSSGLLLGLSIIIKHQGIFFAGFAALYLFLLFFKIPRTEWRSCLLKYSLFLFSLAIPFLSLCLYFAAVGLFGKFWFWLFEYPREYVSLVPLSQGLETFRYNFTSILHSAILFWILALIGLIALFYDRQIRKLAPFIVLFLISSVFVIIPGFHFFPHYFVLMIPVLALLFALGGCSLAALVSKNHPIIRTAAPILLCAGAIIYLIVAERAYLFELTPSQISRTLYGREFPFPESVKVGEYIKTRSVANDTVAVFGSEPEIFFYAQRRSATPHIYIYPLMGTQKYARLMQQEMISQVETARPKFLVIVKTYTSWNVTGNSDKLLFNWLQNYRDNFYRIVGIADIISDQKTVYFWDQQAQTYKPESEYWIAVFERKD